MGQYKFLDSRYIDSLLGGQIRFGRLIYYRLLEVVTKDEWIGDASEGVALTHVENISITSEAPNPIARKRLEEARIVKMGDGSSVSFTNSTFIREVDCYVFCFSVGELRQLTDTMCDPGRPDYAYDGCVSIVDPVTLASAIARTGTVNGIPVSDKFVVSAGPVDYRPTAHDFFRDGVAPANPFKKHHRYSAQQEARIVLTPREPFHSDFVSVTIGSPAILFSEQFRHLPIRKEPAASPRRDGRSLADLFNVLSAALRAWDGLQSTSIHTAMSMNSDQWIEVMTRESAERDKAFDKFRDEVVHAYWRMRDTFPDNQIDRAIARSAKAFVLINHLRMYLLRTAPLLRADADGISAG
jgi:hypothetical protein